MRGGFTSLSGSSGSVSVRLWSSSGSLQWTPGGVLGDNVADGDSSSGNQSWGNGLGTDVVFTRSDGNQSGRPLVSSRGGDVSGSRGNSGDGSDRSDSRELHF